MGPYYQKQDVTNTLFNVFNLAEETNVKSGIKNIIQNLKERARSYHYKIIPKTKLKYSMYTDIKKMIKNSSIHNIDKPELASDWSNRRQKSNKVSHQ